MPHCRPKLGAVRETELPIYTPKRARLAASILSMVLLCLFTALAQANPFPEANGSNFSSVTFAFWSDADDNGEANTRVDHMLDLLQRAGVGAIQLDMEWSNFEDAKQYHFERFDHTWAACAARRIRIDARLGGFPNREVATKKLNCKGDIAQCIAIAATTDSKEYRTYLEALANYTAAVVTHYSELWAKLVRDSNANQPIDETWNASASWDLWNEPNWPWGGPPQIMPNVLVASIRTMVTQIRRLAPGDTIIAPAIAFIDTRPISPHGYGNSGSDPMCGLVYCRCPSCNDSQCIATNCYEKYGGYLEATFRQGMLNLVDGISLHPYRPSGPETIITPQRQPLPAPQYWPATFSTVRTLMNRYGGQGVQIVVNEWGWANSRDYGYGDVTDQRQADYLARMMLVNLSYRDSTQVGIPLSNWYQVADDGALKSGVPGYEGHFGLLDVNGNPKSSYRALQTLTHSLSNAVFSERLVDADSSTAQLLLFREHRAESNRQTLVAWNADNNFTINPVRQSRRFSGTYLLNSTPLYIGEILTWAGSNHHNWSDSGAWTDADGKSYRNWPDPGFQARFNTPADIELAGSHTLSGIQFNETTTLHGGILKFTPGGANVFVAPGKRATLSAVSVGNMGVSDPNSATAVTTLNHFATSSLRKCGWGVLALGADSSFRGTVLVGEGFIHVQSDQALGAPSNPLRLFGGGIDLNGHNLTTGPLIVDGDASIVNYGTHGSLYSPESLEVRHGSLSIVTGSTIAFSSPMVVHRGARAAMVGASIVSTEAIMLNGGDLFQNSLAALNARAINIVEGGTLGGTGKVTAPLVVTDGHISPGFNGAGALGTLTVDGEVTIMPASSFEIDVDATGLCDLLVITGKRRNVRLAGVLNIQAMSRVSSGSHFTIVTNASSAEHNFRVGRAPAGLVWSVSTVPVGDGFSVVLSAN